MDKIIPSKEDVKIILDFFDNHPQKDYCAIFINFKGTQHEMVYWRKHIDWLKSLV